MLRKGKTLLLYVLVSRPWLIYQYQGQNRTIVGVWERTALRNAAVLNKFADVRYLDKDILADNYGAWNKRSRV